MRLISYRRAAAATASASSRATAMDAGLDLLPGRPGDDGGPARRRAGRLLEALRRRPAARSYRRDGRPLDEVELLAPVPRPGKVVAIGRNYREHTSTKRARTPPPAPLIFAKWPSSVIGPGADDPLGPGADVAGRLRGRARGRHRPADPPRLDAPTPSTPCSATRASTTSRRATSSSATANGSAASRSTRSARWVPCSSPPTSSPTRRTSRSRAPSTARSCQRARTRREMFFGVADDHQPLLAGVHARAGRRHRDRDTGRRRRLPRPAASCSTDGDVVSVEIERIGRLTNTCRVRGARRGAAA